MMLKNVSLRKTSAEQKVNLKNDEYINTSIINIVINDKFK
jgi:hypothetical protein